MATIEVPTLSVLNPEFQRDPYAAFARARERSWIVSTELGYQVLTYDACVELMRDRRFQNGGEKLARMSGITSGPFFDAWTSSILYSRGADHVRLKKILTPFFGFKAVEQMRVLARRLMNEYLDEGGEELEFMTQVASRLPAALFCQMVDVPFSEAAFISRISDSLLKIFFMDPRYREEIEAAYTELDTFVRDLIAQRRKNPGEDLVSTAIAAHEAGDRLTEEETVNLVATVLEASTDNTSNQIALALALLIEHPDQWDLLRADPSLLRSAVEECCRFSPRIYVAQRMADEAIEFRGFRIPDNEWILPSVASAHRDPNAYPEPDRFDITRKPMPPQLIFGGGEHACIGAPLARIELQEALAVIAERCARVEFAAPPGRIPSSNVQALSELRLRFTAA
jgi:cytochrome P450